MATFNATARPTNEEETKSSSPSNQIPSIRILCLHGGYQNSEIFKDQLTPLMTYIKSRVNKHNQKEQNDGLLPPIEFVFCNGPLLNDETLSYTDLPSESNPNPKYLQERKWFHEPSDPLTGKLPGLDASLLWLNQCWNSCLLSNPYHGILAFSQGAALASMLPLITARHYNFINLEFVININGYIPNPPPKVGLSNVDFEDHFRTEYVDMPSLNIYGTKNDIVTPSESETLSKRFVNPVVYTHKHGHGIPNDKKVLNVIFEFLKLNTKEIIQGFSADLYKMQKRLGDLELEASRMIANVSGINPPRALMAVIDRTAVAGWSGDRRVEPGGGAPCPSDFIRKVGERRVNSEGGGREKPVGKAKDGGGEKYGGEKEEEKGS